MKTKTLSLLSAVLFAVLPATADVIFDNGGPAQVNSYLSELTAGQQMADDFVLQPGASFLTDVHWFGVYCCGNTPEIDSFTIRIFDDLGGVPNANPFYEVSGVGGNRSDSGLDESSLDIYEYDADITPIALAANTTYWLSIVNDTPNDVDDHWFWSTSIPGAGLSAIRDVDGDVWRGLSTGPELAFYLTSRTVVPEPASIALLGLGTAGLAVRMRRRKA